MALSNKVWSVVLVASLGLNLFCLGLFAAHALRRRAHPHAPHEHEMMAAPPHGPVGGPHPHAGPRDAGREGEEGGGILLRRLVRAAGGPSDARVRRAWEGSRAALGGARSELASARREVERTLLEEPFQPAHVEEALEKLRRSSAALQAESHRTLTTLAAELTPEERKRLAPAAGPTNGRD
ncbi:MAG TPA: periplasmic heavy metal sensor [Polyangiaceae bacterium]|nr:periplasmic heavy metal sensor [Polyangiaceae bacterium]